MAIEKRYVERFKRQLASGNTVLFTGAGFSYDAIAVDGQRVISAGDLKVELARIAFPSSNPAETDSSLADLYDVAVSRGEGRVKNLLEQRLRVDRSRTPERFNRWFALPWKRHYTLNIDDLDQVVQGRASLPRPILAIPASLHETPQTNDLLSVHLNGRLVDFPDVTFTARQYARRLGMPDPWYSLLTSDLLSNPVVFVGTVLDEPGLWQHIELRSTRGQGDVELRPPSYLVSPSLPAARAALLKRFNVDWLQASEKEFFDEVLAGSASEAEQGLQAIRRQHHPATASGSLKPVAQLRNEKPHLELELFLQGREPTWADMQPEGYAVERQFEASLARRAIEGEEDIILITGTAASGKTTTAMRLALSLETSGKKCFAYDTKLGSLSAAQVLSAARNVKPEVLFIDDVDRFGETAGRLLGDLARLPRSRKIIATIRNSRLQGLPIEEELEGVASYFEVTTPHLVDSDIDAVIASLTRAGLLGRMTGMNLDQRRRLFRDQAGRLLLVAMYYATSGVQLEDKVRSECEDLGGAARMAYGMAALSTVERQSVTKGELLIALNALGFTDDGNKVLNQVEKLVQRALLIKSDDGYAVRHRWIAEKSVDFFSANGLLHKVILGMAFALATQVDPQTSPHTRERRMLRRLVNHDFLQRMIDDVDQCREIYSRLQDRLGWDYHYWLQRGSLEVERGDDFGPAMTYLESARSLSNGTDWLVESEYSYLLLKRASSNPTSPSARKEADTALLDLEENMRARGAKDSYPFHIYGSQGLRWARRASLTGDERKTLLGKLLNAVREGRRHHPKREDLRQLEVDIEREYLLQAAK